MLLGSFGGWQLGIMSFSGVVARRHLYLQCFDTVGLATRRVSGLQNLGVGLLVVMI